MQTEGVNLPSEGSEFYDAVAGGPIGAEPINGELATATVSQTNKRSPAFLDTLNAIAYKAAKKQRRTWICKPRKIKRGKRVPELIHQRNRRSRFPPEP
jgi:hypothetical protein